MDTFPCATTTSSKNQPIARRSANYHPSVWGDYFLVYASDDAKRTCIEEEQELLQLKQQVTDMLNGTPDKSQQKLDLINAIQRLGVSYHFEAEIEASLQNIFNEFEAWNEQEGNDLYTLSLCFRLLRQQGHHVSCDVFNVFKNPDGNFKESLVKDLRGMLSLYEAANFRVHGENILEEALRFTSRHLESLMPHLSDFHAKQVNQALKFPIQKSLIRIEARQYVPVYKEEESRHELLLNFAKMDFNRLQKMHQTELSDITKWWKSLDCPKNFPFARDRVVECYFWIMGVYFEPKYCFARRILTKVIATASIMDDIYDVYGTIDELILLTNAIERWDFSALNQLPLCLRHFYKALLDVYTEIEEELAKEGKSGRVDYAKAQMKKLVRAYLQEAHWFHDGYVPTFAEYMKVALVTGAYMMLATTSLVGMGELVTNEALDWMSNEPLIVRSASVISRLMDDMAGHKFEQERGHVASAVECYMNQFDAPKEKTYDEFQKQITNAWKDINQECLNPTAVPKPLLDRVVNLARVIHVLYTNGDGYTISKTKTKGLISSLLVDPLTL